jgi:hypothetical protein
MPIHFTPPGFDDLSIDEKHREVNLRTPIRNPVGPD